MGRWRPPPEKSSPYITPEGAKSLNLELKTLWQKSRPEVVRALSAAAAEGDRSENAEYIYRKKQLGEIDRRIRYISKRLDNIQVVDRLPADQSKVFFGAWVEVSDEEGVESRYRIVGADEAGLQPGYISVDSVVARALIGRFEGDEVSVQLPLGKQVLLIEAVSYEAAGEG